MTPPSPATLTRTIQDPYTAEERWALEFTERNRLERIARQERHEQDMREADAIRGAR